MVENQENWNIRILFQFYFCGKKQTRERKAALKIITSDLEEITFLGEKEVGKCIIW